MQDRSHILVVEDDPNDEIMTLRTLRKSKALMEVTVARDGAEALDLLFGNSGPGKCRAPIVPDCVLMDLHLPKVSGIEVLQRIRGDARTRGIRVMMLTGSDSQFVASEVLRHGADACLMKPLRAEMIEGLLNGVK